MGMREIVGKGDLEVLTAHYKMNEAQAWKVKCREWSQ